MYRQDFHLQTLTCLAIAISPLCKRVPHWFGFCVRLEVQESEVRHLWHCRIWPWPQRSVVEQYVSNFDSTLFRSSCSQIRWYVDIRFLIVQKRPPSDLRFSSLYRLGLKWQSSWTGTCFSLRSHHASHTLSVWPCLFPRCASLFRIFFIVQVSTGF